MEEIFILLKSTNNHQTQFGDEVKLKKQFIAHFYYEREYSKDSHDRFVIVVKYGDDYLRILDEKGNKFENWYYGVNR